MLTSPGLSPRSRCAVFVLPALLAGCVHVTGYSDYQATLKDTSRVGVRLAKEKEALLPTGEAKPAQPQGNGVFSKELMGDLLRQAGGAEGAKIADRLASQKTDQPAGAGPETAFLQMREGGVPRYQLKIQRSATRIDLTTEACADPACSTTRADPRLPKGPIALAHEPMDLATDLASPQLLSKDTVLPFTRHIVLSEETQGDTLKSSYVDLTLEAKMADVERVEATELRSRSLGVPLMIAGILLFCVGEYSIIPVVQEKDFSKFDGKLAAETGLPGLFLFIWGIRNMSYPTVQVYPD